MGFYLYRYNAEFAAFDIDQIGSYSASQTLPFMSQSGEYLIVKHIYENDAYDDHKFSFIRNSGGTYDLYVYDATFTVTTDSR